MMMIMMMIIIIINIIIMSGLYNLWYPISHTPVPQKIDTQTCETRYQTPWKVDNTHTNFRHFEYLQVEDFYFKC